MLSAAPADRLSPVFTRALWAHALMPRNISFACLVIANRSIIMRGFLRFVRFPDTTHQDSGSMIPRGNFTISPLRAAGRPLAHCRSLLQQYRYIFPCHPNTPLRVLRVLRVIRVRTSIFLRGEPQRAEATPAGRRILLTQNSSLLTKTSLPTPATACGSHTLLCL